MVTATAIEHSVTDTQLDAQIAEAERAIEQAADALTAAKVRDLRDGDNWRAYERARTNLRNAGERFDALDKERRLRTHAGMAAARRAAEVQAANTAHADAEKAARKDIDAMEAALADSRSRVAKAAILFVKAAMQAYDAADAHNTLVRTSSAQLLERGLKLEDPDLGLAWDTGSHDGVAGAALRIRGNWWPHLSAPAVFMRAAWGAARAKVGDQHDLTRRLHRFPGVDRLDGRPDQMLADAPLPAPYQPPAVAVPRPVSFADLAEYEMVPPADPGDPKVTGYTPSDPEERAFVKERAEYVASVNASNREARYGRAAR